MIDLLQPVKFARCKCCNMTISFDPTKARFKKYCDSCREEKQKARTAEDNLLANVHTQIVREMGGPAIMNVINRAAIRTRAETGKILGMSAEQVRRIEMEAFAKLFIMGQLLSERQK